ncbi:hypothetical protein Daesc_000196 [Daldinia eschscholtzii]|uniref:Casein kinase substrate phosphoprotein PP28 domain-containing protein n=1 Tax=Daldinia eschscholtzii TaxID=292717 RepID=A0AAX6MYY7_9PEZI
MATKGMSDLSLNPPSTTTTAPKGKSTKGKKAALVADSWEDEDASPRPHQHPVHQGPGHHHHGKQSLGGEDRMSDSNSANKRPEKTDAVARRMIASALGVRAPRPTEEQRAYDRAVREKERKRREEEKEAEKKRKEEAERAKVAIWED